MDKDFPNSDVSNIYDEIWGSLNYSEVLQSGVNFDPPMTMMDMSQSALVDSMLYDGGFDPMINNHDTYRNSSVDWVNLPDSDFKNCMDQAELWAKRARAVYKESESVFEASILNEGFLQEQLKQRDEYMQRLQHDIQKEQLRKSQQIYRLQREILAMRKLVKGYREQLKEVNRNFEEYRARVLQHNATHSDSAAGSQGPIVSTKGPEN